MSGADDMAQPARRDGMPMVAKGKSSNLGLIFAAIVILLGGFMVFNALQAGGDPAKQPATLAPSSGFNDRITSPAPLALPVPIERVIPEASPTPEPVALVQQQPRFVPAPVTAPPPPRFEPAQLPARVSPPPPQPQVIFEARDRASPSSLDTVSAREGAERVYADRFENPSTTIPRGTVIPAVLETAIDSTRPGGVRALVQRDVHSFDGTQVLIQRGSRLYGEYGADLQSGQGRAMIQWSRLIRPDGVTIALDSPASDPLGRAGVKGDVDNKFFQRFGGAILQSFLDIGVGLAAHEATDGVIVALPGSTQNLQIQQQQTIQPTLRVDQGTSVSVFVARELDFASVL